MKAYKQISHYMHDNAVVGFTQDTVLSILELMSQYYIRHVPILDDNLQLYRIITDTDLIILLGNNPSLKTSRMTIAELPQQNVKTINETDTIDTAIMLMSDNNISCLPVIEDEDIIGIITIKDILKADTFWEQLSNPEINPYGTTIGKMVTEHPLISMDYSLWQTLDMLKDRENRNLFVQGKYDNITGIISSLPIIFEIIDYNRRVLHIRKKYSFEEFMFTSTLDEVMQSSPIHVKSPIKIGTIRKLMIRHNTTAIILGTAKRPLRVINERDLFDFVDQEVRHSEFITTQKNM